MLGSLRDLFLHHPAYRFGRLDLPRDEHRPRSGLEECEELERRKFLVDEFEEQWRQSPPSSFVRDLAAMLLILLALWGVASLSSVLFDSAPLQREQVSTEAIRDATFQAHAASGVNSQVDLMPCRFGACADHQQAQVLRRIPDTVQACLPERIHPVSRQYLDAFLLGHISRAQFRRSFPLPSSDYLAVQDCIIAAVETLAQTDFMAPPAAHRD
jgi:hypothetical protein